MKQGKRIKVGYTHGSLTCFAIDIDGNIYGISAAHVLLGENKYSDLKDIVYILNRETKRWLKSGVLIEAIYSNGLGKASNWGLIDSGIYLLNNSFLKRIRSNLKKLEFSNLLKLDANDLKGVHVFSYSNRLKKSIEGKIYAVNYTSKGNTPHRFDLVIEGIEKVAITKKEDSGILWLDGKGRAVAMHIHGSKLNSNISYCTFINRVANLHNIRLLQLK